MEPRIHDDAKMARTGESRRAVTTMPKKPRATYEDLLNAPDTVIAEILEGELFTSPRPRGRHAVVHGNLHTALHPPFSQGAAGPGGWWILFEPQLHLNEPEDVAVPDLAGWRRERMPQVPEGVEFRVPPDWVCEILSPSTERMDRTRKLRIYARAGVRFVWLVNPAERILEVLHLEHGQWVLVDVVGDEETIRVKPFEAIEIDLSLIWAS
jgi:Uma2 family endonuclease